MEWIIGFVIGAALAVACCAAFGSTILFFVTDETKMRTRAFQTATLCLMWVIMISVVSYVM